MILDLTVSQLCPCCQRELVFAFVPRTDNRSWTLTCPVEKSSINYHTFYYYGMVENTFKLKIRHARFRYGGAGELPSVVSRYDENQTEIFTDDQGVRIFDIDFVPISFFDLSSAAAFAKQCETLSILV